MVLSYSGIVAFACLSLLAQCVLVKGNVGMSRDEKKSFQRAYLFLLLSTVSEWGAVMLGVAGESAHVLQLLCKFIHYSASPYLAIMFSRQLNSGERSGLDQVMTIVFGLNIALEAMSLYSGNIFYIDSNNEIQRGPQNYIYVFFSILAVIYLVLSFIRYGRQFKRNDLNSLFSICMLTCCGIYIQHTSGVKIASLGICVSSIMLYSHYNQFVIQKRNEMIDSTEELLNRDALTGALSRYAYSSFLEKLAEEHRLPNNLAVLLVDVNGLKTVNDNIGHEAGDEMIKGACECIRRAINQTGIKGTCYRVGGDEFVVVLKGNKEDVPALMNGIRIATSEWRGKLVKTLSMSIGSAHSQEYPLISAEKLVNVADHRMYIDKEKYYKSIGRKR